MGFDSHTQQPPAASEGPQEPQESCVQFAARSSRISLMPNLSARALRLASSSGLCTPRPVSVQSQVYSDRRQGAGESWTHSAGAANRLARSAFFASSADGLSVPNRSALCARQRTRETMAHAQRWRLPAAAARGRASQVCSPPGSGPPPAPSRAGRHQYTLESIRTCAVRGQRGGTWRARRSRRCSSRTG